MVLIIISALFAAVYSKKDSDELGLCSLAVAQFDGSQGVTGFVNIDQNGKVLIRLDTSDLDATMYFTLFARFEHAYFYEIGARMTELADIHIMFTMNGIMVIWLIVMVVIVVLLTLQGMKHLLFCNN